MDYWRSVTNWVDSEHHLIEGQFLAKGNESVSH